MKCDGVLLLNYLHLILNIYLFILHILEQPLVDHFSIFQFKQPIFILQTLSINNMMKSTEGSQCCCFRSQTLHPTDRRNQHIQNIRNTIKEVPLFKQNIIRNEQRRSKSRASSQTANYGFSEATSPFSAIKTIDKVETVKLFELKYELLEKIGEGSNGLVRKCRSRESGKIFAVKSCTFEDEHLPHLKSNFLLVSRLRHPHIVHYESLYIDMQKRTAWLVMEYLNFSSLDKAVINSEEDMKRVMFQVLQTLSYVHKHDLVHRDIKPANILYDADSKNIKIIDFGIAKRSRKGGQLVDMWTVTGTLFYRAPQMFEGDGYRQSVDVWAAGVLLYKMVSGKTPFESTYHTQTINKIRSCQIQFPFEFEKYSNQLKKFISRLLSRKLEERPNASTCLKDPWLTHLSRIRQISKQNDNTFTAQTRAPKEKSRLQMSMSIKDGSDNCFEMERLEEMRSVRSYNYDQNGAKYHCISDVRNKL